MAERSRKFQAVKDYYEQGLWSEDMVKNAAGRWITQAEAEEILALAPEAGREVSAGWI